MCIQTSLPVILFGDEHMKVLRMILRDRYVADPKRNLYFIYTGDIWVKTNRDHWINSIYSSIERYASRFSWKKPDDHSIKKAITFLYKDNINNKIHGDMNGFRIAVR